MQHMFSVENCAPGCVRRETDTDKGTRKDERRRKTKLSALVQQLI